MKTDPTDNGGLFVGRRPGTRPVKYRRLPEFRGERRRLVDRALAIGMLVLMALIVAAFWGPLPLAWLWIGSQADYQSGSTFLGIIVAFMGLLFTLLIGLMLLRGLDEQLTLRGFEGDPVDRDGNRVLHHYLFRLSGRHAIAPAG